MFLYRLLLSINKIKNFYSILQIFLVEMYISPLAFTKKSCPEGQLFYRGLVGVELHEASPGALDAVASVILHVERELRYAVAFVADG